jgi:7-carboxy-7-deazaguanine synthase (Cx14CxxC type)
MAYQVKEIFFTLQGEGANAGRPAVFCRFSGCNLWNGREEDRSTARCYFCDTDFVGIDGDGGGRFASAAELAEAISAKWPIPLERDYLDRSGCRSRGMESPTPPFVVFTGGEPLLQLDELLLREIKKLGFEVAVETNGTIEAPYGIDWLTVSPKPNAALVQRSGSELKLVFPHEIRPEDVDGLSFQYFYLSPLALPDPAQTQVNLSLALAYVQSHPHWRLSLQLHKLLGIP